MNLATVDHEMYVQYRLDDMLPPRNMPPFLEVQLLYTQGFYPHVCNTSTSAVLIRALRNAQQLSTVMSYYMATCRLSALHTYLDKLILNSHLLGEGGIH